MAEGEKKKAQAESSSSGADKIKARCPNCGTAFNAPAAYVGKQVSCPKCKEKIAVTPLAAPKQEKPKPKPKSDDPLALGSEDELPKGFERLDDEERHTESAWKEFEDAKRDTFTAATLKAILYPYQALGALVFFVAGVPLALAIVEAAGKAALRWGGDLFRENETNLGYFAAGITFVTLAAALACVSFFCSFIFAVIRTSSEGRRAIPVIEGMHHRSNLAAACAWASCYFGPALYAGYFLAGGGSAFEWSAPVIVLLALLGALAPMGLLCTATVSPVAGLNPVNVGKGIAKVWRQYLFLWLIFGAGLTLYVLAGVLVGTKAAEAYARGEWYYGLPIRIASNLFFMFPPVVLARELGLLLQYHEEEMPFEFNANSEYTKGIIPQLLALAGAVAIFLPMWTDAKTYAQIGGAAQVARRHLQERIYEGHLRDGNGRIVYVNSPEELLKRVGETDIVCPARPDRKDFYGIAPAPVGGGDTDCFIWIYEKEPTWPDGEKLNALLRGGGVRSLSKNLLQELLSLMDKYNAETRPEERAKLLEQYKEKAPPF